MNHAAIQSTVESLKSIYTIVIALSIGETFRQFVVPAGSPNEENGIQRNRLPALACFLLLVIPFYQGMSRYFCDTYSADPGPHYGGWLLVDCLVFTTEAGLFFVLSRSLPRRDWLRFFHTVLVLLVLDALWGAVVWCWHTDVIRHWVVVNLFSLVILGIVLLAYHRTKWKWVVPAAYALIFLRTFADYLTSWPLYFPY